MSGHYPDGTTQADIDRHLDGSPCECGQVCPDCGEYRGECACNISDGEGEGDGLEGA